MKNYFDEEDDEQTDQLVDGVDVKNADEYENVPIEKGDMDKQIEAELADYENNENMLASMSSQPMVQPATLGSEEPSVPSTPTDKYKETLQKFSKFKYNPEEFKKLQNQKLDTNKNVDILQAANLITKGLAAGAGGNIGDASEMTNQLRKTAEIPVEQYKESMKGQKEGYDLDYDSEMNDPTSDISKFSREMAIQKAKKLGLNDTVMASLENMSAKQLEKLGLANPNQMSIRTPQQSDYETADGQPLSFDPLTNSYINILSGEKYTGDVRRKVIQQFVDPNTGQMMLRDRTNIMGISPTNTLPQKIAEESPITRRDLNPKDKDLLDKTRDELNKDPRYKNSQEAVDGADNALVLLKGNIQGGDLVRAIQTMLSKSAGNTGVLTEPDVQGFGGRQDVISRLGAMATLATQNKLTEGDRKFLTQYATAMQKAAKRNLLEATKVYETQLANDLGIKPSQSTGLLNIEQRANPVLETQPMVRVVEVKTGKTGSMPKDQADKAVKSGKYQLEGKK